MIVPLLVLMPPYLQYVGGNNNLITALVLFPRSFGMGVSTLVSAQLVQRFGPRQVALLGCLIWGLGLWWMHGIEPDTSSIEIAIQGMVQTIGIGLWTVPAAVIAFSSLRPGLRTEAASMLKVVQGFAMAIGAAVSTAVFVQGVRAASYVFDSPPFISDSTVIDGSAQRISKIAFLHALNENISYQIILSVFVFILLYLCTPKVSSSYQNEVGRPS
jgi:DHA2 family multidrug resistance protein